MFNRQLAITIISYFDLEHSRHIDISELKDVIKDEDPLKLHLIRFDLPTVLLSYSTQEVRDQTFISLTELLEITYQGSSSW